MKRWLAAVITCGLLWVVAWNRDPSVGPAAPRRERSPAECVEAMFRAAAAGEVEAYLNCFGGALRTQLELAIGDSSVAEFSQGLQNSSDNMKGYAILSPDESHGASVTLVIERIYAQRTERQQVILGRVGNDWRIVQVENVASYLPLRTYGSPVWAPEEASGDRNE